MVLLDNCEHLPGLGPTVEDLLASCPSLRIVATSRAPLRVPGEHVFPVRPLTTSAAVTLFEGRAQAAAPQFEVTDRNRSVVTELCNRLDGLPLAIELAAARTKIVTPDAILERIDRCLEFLTDRRADVGDRHKSPRAALEWSHELLGPDERRFFRRLAAFRGPFTFEAAESLSGEDGVAVIGLLEAMLDHNLVQHVEVVGAPHFRLLETIRSFADEHLTASGDDDSTRRRHAEHYARFAKQLAKQLHGPDQLAALAQLAAQYDNMRTSLQWWLEHDPPGALAMSCALAPYRDAKSALTEGREWLTRAMAAPATPWFHRATASTWASYLAALQGDLSDAERLATNALALWDRHGVAAGLGYAKLMLGFVAVERGDLDAGTSLLTMSLEALEAAGDRWGAVRPLNNLGEIARARGELGRAGEHHARALATSRDLGDLASQPNILSDLGHVRLLQGEASVAREMAREAIEVSEMLGNKLGTATALELLGLARLAHAPIQAALVLGAAEAIRAELGTPVEARDRDRLARARSLGQVRAGTAFDEAWAAGASQPIDEVVSDVLTPGADDS